MVDLSLIFSSRIHKLFRWKCLLCSVPFLSSKKNNMKAKAIVSSQNMELQKKKNNKEKNCKPWYDTAKIDFAWISKFSRFKYTSFILWKGERTSLKNSFRIKRLKPPPLLWDLVILQNNNCWSSLASASIWLIKVPWFQIWSKRNLFPQT